MANYIVGDIQGCYSGLTTLLKKVRFDPKKDKLWAVGDLVGRGPESLETLKFLHSLGDSFDTVLGNHDLHLLAVYCGFRPAKAADKFGELLASKRLPTYIKWLRNKPLALMYDKKTLITHAGLYPLWSFKTALSLSAEVSKKLQNEDWKSLLAKMYANTPATWSPALNDIPRWRFIINAFTRMRFIEKQSQLNFSCKSSPTLAPQELTPWFQIRNESLEKNDRIVFGHWAALQGDTQSKAFIALDTGYVWGQTLTIMDLQSGMKTSIKH
ncbi:MAG: bis(5'-nucleosyl)-tetraphosphatase (symmetrical) [Paraglaciecola sp.]